MPIRTATDWDDSNNFGDSTVDLQGCVDTDSDGVSDINDPRPNDPSKSIDTDSDGYADTRMTVYLCRKFNQWTSWLSDSDGMQTWSLMHSHRILASGVIPMAMDSETIPTEIPQMIVPMVTCNSWQNSTLGVPIMIQMDGLTSRPICK